MTTPSKKIEILHQEKDTKTKTRETYCKLISFCTRDKVLLKKPHVKKRVFLEKEMENEQEAMIRRKH